jgi:hypothetical protein
VGTRAAAGLLSGTGDGGFFIKVAAAAAENADSSCFDGDAPSKAGTGVGLEGSFGASGAGAAGGTPDDGAIGAKNSTEEKAVAGTVDTPDGGG